MHAGNNTLLLTYIYIYCILFIKYISDSLVTGIETGLHYISYYKNKSKVRAVDNTLNLL